MARESHVGQAVYDKVEALKADNPGMTQQAAFEALHEQEPERAVASIAANYYRVQRNLRGSKARKRTRVRRVAVTPQHTPVDPVMDFDRIEQEIVLAAEHATAAVRSARSRFEEIQRLVRA